MADNVTVDSLAIEIQANASGAAASVKELSLALSDMAEKLAPVQGLLARVTKMLIAAKGSTPALKAAFQAAANGSDRMGDAASRAQAKIAALNTTYAQAMKQMQAGGGGVSLTMAKSMQDSLNAASAAVQKLRVENNALVAAGKEPIISQAEFDRMDRELEDMRLGVQRVKNAMRDLKVPNVRVAKPMPEVGLGTAAVGSKLTSQNALTN